MKKLSLWNADLHVHTNLSFCAPKETVPESYLPFCEEENINILGFTNHLYPSHWLKNRGLKEERGAEYALRIRPQLDELRRKTDIKILMGCEVETICGQEPTLSYEEAKDFDYVLLAASHVMNIAGEYRAFDLSTPEKLRDMILERFNYACNLEYPVPVAICHPLYPICSEWEQEVVDGISDSVLAECFTLAAKKDISIEIHACLFRRGTQLNEMGLSPSYLRVLSAAKSCGCKFHFGADAHEPESFRGVHYLLRLAAEQTGITPDDMWTLPSLEK